MTFDLAGQAGRLEALLDAPAGDPVAAAVLAHPHPEYGGSMRSRVVHEATKGLVRAGCAVLRFNYRGVGLSAGRFTGGAGEVKDFLAALDALTRRYPALPIWAAGHSFGAWVAMATGAADPRVVALIGIAVPFGHHDLSGAEASSKAKFLVHGDHDEFCPLKVVQQHYGAMSEPRELVIVDGGDHAFDGTASDVGDALYGLLQGFHA